MNLVIIPLAFTGALSWLNRQTKKLLVTYYGPNSQVWLGGLGIMIHETSHLIAALIFLHRIDAVKLLQFPSTNQQTLGYVRHSWNQQSKYQQLGNFFIGLAPVVGCSLVLAGLGFWLVPNLMHTLMAWGINLSSGQLAASPDLRIDKWWHILLFIILATNISWGGFDLSPADLQNTSTGAWLWGVVLVVGTLTLTLVSPHGTWLSGLKYLGWGWAILLGFALLLSFFLQLILRIVIRFTK